MIFLIKLLQFSEYLVVLYKWIVIAAVILSWINPNPQHEFLRGLIRAIYVLTEPALRWIRSRIPTVFGGLDFAPVILLLALMFVQYVIVQGLIGMLIGSSIGG